MTYWICGSNRLDTVIPSIRNSKLYYSSDDQRQNQIRLEMFSLLVSFLCYVTPENVQSGEFH